MYKHLAKLSVLFKLNSTVNRNYLLEIFNFSAPSKKSLFLKQGVSWQEYCTQKKCWKSAKEISMLEEMNEDTTFALLLKWYLQFAGILWSARNPCFWNWRCWLSSDKLNILWSTKHWKSARDFIVRRNELRDYVHTFEVILTICRKTWKRTLAKSWANWN